MFLEIVRVQFDQARQQIVAVPVSGLASGRDAALQIADEAVFDTQGACKFFISRDDASVPDQHRRAPYVCLPLCSVALIRSVVVVIRGCASRLLGALHVREDRHPLSPQSGSSEG